MKPPTTNCPKCSGEMCEGFIVDRGAAGFDPARWFAGPLVVGWLNTPKTSGKPIFVITFRCVECGFLESYAPPPPPKVAKPPE